MAKQKRAVTSMGISHVKRETGSCGQLQLFIQDLGREKLGLGTGQRKASFTAVDDAPTFGDSTPHNVLHLLLSLPPS